MVVPRSPDAAGSPSVHQLGNSTGGVVAVEHVDLDWAAVRLPAYLCGVAALFHAQVRPDRTDCGYLAPG